MFELNELIMLRDALILQESGLCEVLLETKNEGLKTLRIEQLERITALHNKVQSELNLSAKFDG